MMAKRLYVGPERGSKKGGALRKIRKKKNGPEAADKDSQQGCFSGKAGGRGKEAASDDGDDGPEWGRTKPEGGCVFKGKENSCWRREKKKKDPSAKRT